MRDCEKGLTLVEVMIALVVLVALAGVVPVVMTKTASGQADLMARQHMENDGHLALERLAQETRLADPSTLTIGQSNGAGRLSCNLPIPTEGKTPAWSSTVVYEFQPSTVDSNRNGVQDEGMLARVQDGEVRVLCHHVRLGGVSFVRVGDELRMRLELRRRNPTGHLVDVTIETAVTLRNGG